MVPLGEAAEGRPDRLEIRVSVDTQDGVVIGEPSRHTSKTSKF
jgi:hypothetical protein